MRTPATVGLLVTFHCTFAFVPTRTARTLGVSWTNPVDPFTLNANAKSSTSMKIYATNKNPVQSFFDGILKKNSAPKEAEPEKPKIPDAVIKEDYKLGIVFALIGAVIFLLFPSNSCAIEGLGICPPSIYGAVAGGIHLLLGSLFLVQASAVRFVFDETCFELKRLNRGGDMAPILVDSGDNIVVGGANRWPYDTFVNWEFFPNVDYPVLVYFKETQTPKEKWDEGPGKLDKTGGGQVHFFPCICDAKELEKQFQLRGCAKVEK